MFPGTEAVGKQLGEGQFFVASALPYQVNDEIIAAEFPHDLAADTARGECAGDIAVLAAADGDGGKVPLAVVDRLEDGGALGAVGGAVGRVFNVAALVDRAVAAQQGGTYLDLEAN